jgi:hypothetical protein
MNVRNILKKNYNKFNGNNKIFDHYIDFDIINIIRFAVRFNEIKNCRKCSDAMTLRCISPLFKIVQRGGRIRMISNRLDINNMQNMSLNLLLASAI